MTSIEVSKALVQEAFSSADNYAKNLARAETLLRSDLAHEPNNTLLLTGLGAVLCDQAKYEEAIAVLRRAVELGSVDQHTYFNLGVAVLNAGTHEEAMTHFGRANSLSQSPQSWAAYFDPQAH